MTKKQMIEYLRAWVKVNTQEIYGSPREYIQDYKILNELDKLETLDD